MSMWSAAMKFMFFFCHAICRHCDFVDMVVGGKKQQFTIIYVLSTCKAFVFVASEFYRSYSLYCSLCSEIFFLEVVQCDNLSDVVLSVKYSQVLKLKSAFHLPWNIFIEIITVCWILIPCISSILPF